MRDLSFQEQMRRNNCYGCGQDNKDGMHLQSHWIDEGTAACIFQPQAKHSAAAPHYVNGGIIASVVDCHAVATAIASAYMREGRSINEGEEIIYVTGSLKVDYTQPCRIDQALKINATVATVLGKKSIVSCEIWSGKESCGRAQVVCVRIAAEDWFNPPT